MFEKATRMKLRFKINHPSANATVEDLWDLPLSRPQRLKNVHANEIACLDDLAIQLSKEVGTHVEESFVAKKSAVNIVKELMFGIVKRIIKVKLDDIERKENAAIIKTESDQIDLLIAKKKGDQLGELSIEDLEKRKAELVAKV